MPGRILIIDTVATNRIVLKVKMLATQFAVDACGSNAEALRLIAKARPDLILMNLCDPHESRHAFCKQLRNTPETASIAIIAVDVADTAMARFAALDAGADDVLPHPMNDTLLLARIRSLLRARSAVEELVLRENTSRALGFDEEQSSFAAPAHVGLLTDRDQGEGRILRNLTNGLRQKVRVISTRQVMRDADVKPVPDLFVIDAAGADGPDRQALFGLVCDLRSRAQTRLSAQLIIVPDDAPELSAMFLDLGADDVVAQSCETGELGLRAKALIRRKQKSDKLRATVHNGLQAAITDPLTGLYNRRYAESHLARLADQSAGMDQPYAVMMLDVDHFKQVNDVHGHPAGDQVLKHLSACLSHGLRAIDLVARMGGEEFLIAMPRTTMQEAHLAANRLCKLINETRFAFGADGADIQVTVSIGVAVHQGHAADNATLATVCTQADQALFKAKSAGRNQVAMIQSAA